MVTLTVDLKLGQDEARALGGYAREAGIPAEHLGLFEGPTPFLLARKN